MGLFLLTGPDFGRHSTIEDRLIWVRYSFTRRFLRFTKTSCLAFSKLLSFGCPFEKKMNRFALAGFFLCSLTATAQTVITTVQEALTTVRRHNPDLVNARQNQLVQAQQRTATKAVLLPQARLFTNFDYNYALPVSLVPAEFLGGKPGEFRTLQFGLPYVLAAGVEVTVPLINRPARADLGIVDQNLRITDDQTLVLQDDISTQTARVYHATLLTRSAIAITQRNLSAADTLTQIASERLTKGLIEPLEYNRIRSVQLTTADVLYQNELAYRRNLNQLKLLLGLTVIDSLVLTEDLSTRSLGTTSSTTLTNLVERPQITLQQARIDLARLQLNRERLQRWPTLSAYGRFTEQAQRNRINFLNANEPWYQIGVAVCSSTGQFMRAASVPVTYYEPGYN